MCAWYKHFHSFSKIQNVCSCVNHHYLYYPRRSLRNNFTSKKRNKVFFQATGLWHFRWLLLLSYFFRCLVLIISHPSNHHLIIHQISLVTVFFCFVSLLLLFVNQLSSVKYQFYYVFFIQIIFVFPFTKQPSVSSFVFVSIHRFDGLFWWYLMVVVVVVWVIFIHFLLENCFFWICSTEFDNKHVQIWNKNYSLHVHIFSKKFELIN